MKLSEREARKLISALDKASRENRQSWTHGVNERGALVSKSDTWRVKK